MQRRRRRVGARGARRDARERERSHDLAQVEIRQAILASRARRACVAAIVERTAGAARPTR